MQNQVEILGRKFEENQPAWAAEAGFMETEPGTIWWADEASGQAASLAPNGPGQTQAGRWQLSEFQISCGQLAIRCSEIELGIWENEEDEEDEDETD